MDGLALWERRELSASFDGASRVFLFVLTQAPRHQPVLHNCALGCHWRNWSSKGHLQVLAADQSSAQSRGPHCNFGFADDAGHLWFPRCVRAV